MKRLFLISIILSGAVCIYYEFRNTYTFSLFDLEYFLIRATLVLLVALTIIFLIHAIYYFRNDHRFTRFISPLVGIIFLIVLFVHKKWRSDRDAESSIFTANTYQIGNDGGFQLDFKKSGNIKATLIDHWSSEEYWGKYTHHGDTFLLDLPLDFKMGDKGVIEGKKMRLLEDTLVFDVHSDTLPY